jgi:hypothetical protein
MASGPKLRVSVDVCDEMIVDSSLLSAVSFDLDFIDSSGSDFWS